MYCDICHINLCIACVGEHLSDDSKDHKVVPFHERGSTINYPNVRNTPPKYVNFIANIVTFQFVYHLFPREIMTNTKKIDILKTLTNKKELIKKDLQELNNFICPQYQQAASEIPAQKAGVKQHSMILAAALNKQGEALHKEINSPIQKKTL